MVVRSENGLEMEEEVSHDESSSDEESVAAEEVEEEEASDDDETEEVDGDADDSGSDDDDEEEEEEEKEGDNEDNDDENEEDIVEIKGTKFNMNQVAKDANVDDTDEDSDDENEADNEDEENQSPADDEGDDEEGEEGKSGWADAMAKVLNMGKDSEQAPGLLSKAKLDNFQIKSDPVEQRDVVKRQLKKEIEEKGRVKPSYVKDRAKEKMLSKLATRGVVQLFNAVKEQQKDIKSRLNEVGGSVRKREKVYKNIDKEGFLEAVLSGGGNKRKAAADEEQTSSSTAVAQTKKKSKKKVESTVKTEEEEEATSGGWNVIRDDYMLGAKMKDWDKESDNEEVE